MIHGTKWYDLLWYDAGKYTVFWYGVGRYALLWYDVGRYTLLWYDDSLMGEGMGKDS